MTISYKNYFYFQLKDASVKDNIMKNGIAILGCLFIRRLNFNFTASSFTDELTSKHEIDNKCI